MYKSFTVCKRYTQKMMVECVVVVQPTVWSFKQSEIANSVVVQTKMHVVAMARMLHFSRDGRTEELVSNEQSRAVKLGVGFPPAADHLGMLISLCVVKDQMRSTTSRLN